MKIKTWDNLTDETKIVEIEDTTDVHQIIALTDIALGNPEGAVEWDNIKVDGDTIIAFNDDIDHPMKATYEVL